MTSNKFTPSQITTYARLASALFFLVCYINLEFIQSCVNVLWDFLKTQPWYRTVYNETFFVALWAFPAMRPWRYIAKNRLFESYRSVFYCLSNKFVQLLHQLILFKFCIISKITSNILSMFIEVILLVFFLTVLLQNFLRYKYCVQFSYENLYKNYLLQTSIFYLLKLFFYNQNSYNF